MVGEINDSTACFPPQRPPKQVKEVVDGDKERVTEGYGCPLKVTVTAWSRDPVMIIANKWMKASPSTPTYPKDSN